MSGKQLLFIIIISMVLSALIASCGPQNPGSNIPEGAQAGEIADLQACEYKVRKDTYAADCGTLVVPENRNDPDSRPIALPVTRIRALDAASAEPIFWMSGGPGSSNMQFSQLQDLIDDHDIVLVGYRGVDGSSVLDCPEMSRGAGGTGSDLFSNDSLVKFGESINECVTRLQSEGVDLDGYSVPEVVNDLEATRLALGYERVNLLSESYGTRVAMFYTWMFPESIHRSAMIAVNPPGHFVWEPADIDALIAYDADLCAKNEACSARTDDLMQSMLNVTEDMPERWLFLPINSGKVKFISTFLLYNRNTAAVAFDAYLAADAGDPSGLALMSLAYDFMVPSLVTWGDWAAKGSMDYSTDRAWISEMNPPGSVLGSPTSLLVGGATELTGGWPSAPLPEGFTQVQSSAVETLLISGSIDYSTPAQFATDELLPMLENGEQVILFEYGHTNDVWSLQPEALRHLLSGYFTAGTVDDSHFTYQPMSYDVGMMSFPLLAKLLVGVIILLLILVLLFVRRIIRRAGRRNASTTSTR